MNKFFWILFLIAGTLSAQSRWERLGPPQAATIRQLIPDRNRPNLWFVIDEEGFAQSRLYRSTNFGKNWIRSSITDVSSVAVHPVTSEVYAVRHGADIVLASRDGGVHFQQRSVTRAYFNKIIPAPQPGVLFALGNLKKPVSSGLLVSRDDGKNWADVTSLPSCGDDCYYSFSDMMISPFDPKFLMVSGGIFYIDSDPPSKIADVSIVSTDGGANWKTQNNKSYKFYVDPLFADRAFAFNNDGLLQLTKQGFKLVSSIPLVDLTDNPQDANVLFALKRCNECPEYYQDRGVSARLVISRDGGQSWSNDNNDLSHSLRILGLTVDRKLVVGTEGNGIVVRDLNGKWTQSTAFLNPEITDIESSANAVFALSGHRWIMKSENKGGEWHSQPVPSFFAIFADPLRPANLIGNSTDTSIPVFYSFDGGISWHPSSGLSRDNGDLAHVAFDPQNTGVIYLSLEPFVVVYKSTDAGKSFHPLRLHFADSTYYIARMLVDENNPEIVFFVTSNGVYKSVDGGNSVRAINDGLPCTNCAQSPSDIIPLVQRDSYVLLLSDGELLSTNNGGEQWKKIGQAPSPSAHQLTSMDPDGHHLFVTGTNAAANNAIFESTDSGSTWQDITEEFGKGNYIWDMTNGRRSPFFVSTHHGVFTLRQ